MPRKRPKIQRETPNRVEHETLVVSERDRAAFFDVLVNPPKPSERLARALAEHKRRVTVAKM